MDGIAMSVTGLCGDCAWWGRKGDEGFHFRTCDRLHLADDVDIDVECGSYCLGGSGVLKTAASWGCIDHEPKQQEATP